MTDKEFRHEAYLAFNNGCGIEECSACLSKAREFTTLVYIPVYDAGYARGEIEEYERGWDDGVAYGREDS